MLIKPNLCNRITMQSQSLKKAVSEMDNVKSSIDVLYQNLMAENEVLLAEWDGSSKTAFAETNQVTSESLTRLMSYITHMSSNTADFEQDMVQIDEAADQAANGVNTNGM